MWVSFGPQSSQLTHWAVLQEQDLKAPALPHMENGTGTGFALHFFSDGTNLLLPKTNTQMCEWTQPRADKYKQIWVSVGPAPPSDAFPENYLVSCWFRSSCNKRPGLEHTSLHTPVTHTHWEASQLHSCVQPHSLHTLPWHWNQLSFQNPGKREKESFLTFKNSFSVYFTWLSALFMHPFWHRKCTSSLTVMLLLLLSWKWSGSSQNTDL